MILNRAAAVGCVVGVALFPASAQTPSSSIPDKAREAAVRSLQTLRDYAQTRQAQDQGADAPGGLAEDVFVGRSFSDYVIGLEDLQKWDGKDPELILHSTGRVVFLIDSKKDGAQSFVTVANKGGEWAP